MFTGIVEAIGKVSSLEKGKDAIKLRIWSTFRDLSLGESIAVNGVCLTVTEFNHAGESLFFVSPETLNRSNLGSLVAGQFVNLERALRAETRISGHWVQGHVDGKTKLISIESEGESFRVQFEVGSDISKYCVEKGSITLNGVSLTLNSISSRNENSILSITLIPHTWRETNLSLLKIGQFANVEVDILAKYVEKLCLPYLKQSKN